MEGKIYYLKWSSGMFATGIKVMLVDPGSGAKEMQQAASFKAREYGRRQEGDTTTAPHALPRSHLNPRAALTA